MKRFFALLITMVFLLLVLVYLSADKLLEGAIERYGSLALGARVNVHGVFISPYLDHISINKMSISDPKGPVDVIEFANISISYNLKSILEPVAHIYNITLSRPVVFYNVSLQGLDNLSALKESSKKSRASLGKNSAEKHYIIDKLSVENLLVKASLVEIASKDIELPQLTFKDLGKSQGGISAEDAAEIVIDAIVAEVTRSNIKSILQKLDPKKIKELQENLKEIEKGAKENPIGAAVGIVGGALLQ